jgi:CPA1 family monovalent cation:H+ antiporter
MSEEGALLLPVELFVILVSVATAVALLARRAALPYSVALVLAGLGLAVVAPGRAIDVTPDLILAVLLPGLVFEAAYKIDALELRRIFNIVAVLAAPGVLVTAGVVAVVVHLVTGLDPALAFVLGAMISATDPVAVVTLFRKLGVPSRLATSVEAESLLNDGTGVVLFAIAIGAVGTSIDLGQGLVSFVSTIVFSTLIGLVAGVVVRWLMGRADDPLLIVMLSVVAAYGTYLVADRFHESGIIATVVVGIMIGSGRRLAPLSEEARHALDIVWEFVAFLLTALVFLLVGLAISPGLLLDTAPVIVTAFVAITIARALVVYGLIGAGERLLPGASLIPLSYLHVMFWSGLRGAVAVALALALPTDLPQRDLLTGAVYGVVLVTLLVQGTTAGWVVRHAGVPTGQPEEPVAP